MYVCVCACYEDVAIIIDGWADTCEQMMQQGECDRIEHTYTHTYVLCYSVLLTQFLQRTRLGSSSNRSRTVAISPLSEADRSCSPCMNMKQNIGIILATSSTDHTYIHPYAHTYIHTYLRTQETTRYEKTIIQIQFINTQINALIHTVIHTYKHTNLTYHNFLHTYIHTYTYK